MPYFILIQIGNLGKDKFFLHNIILMNFDQENNLAFYRDQDDNACYGRNTGQAFEDFEIDETNGKVIFDIFNNDNPVIANIPIQTGNKFKIVTGSHISNEEKTEPFTPEEEWKSILGIPSGIHSWIELENNDGNVFTFGLTYGGEKNKNGIASPDYVNLICRSKLKKCLDAQKEGKIYTNKNKTLKVYPDEEGGCKNVCVNMVSYSDGERNIWTGQSTRVPQKSISNYNQRFNVRYKGTISRVHLEILQKLLDDSVAYIFNKDEISENPDTPPIYQLMANIPSTYSEFIDVPSWLRPVASVFGHIPSRSGRRMRKFTNNLGKINKYKKLEKDPEKLFVEWKKGNLDLIANCQSFSNDFVHEPLKLYSLLHEGQDFNKMILSKISKKQQEIIELYREKKEKITKLRWNMLRRGLKKTMINTKISQLNEKYNELTNEKENIRQSMRGNNRTKRRKMKRGRPGNISKQQREILLEKERLKKLFGKNERRLHHQRRMTNKAKKEIIKNRANKKISRRTKKISILNSRMYQN